MRWGSWVEVLGEITAHGAVWAMILGWNETFHNPSRKWWHPARNFHNMALQGIPLQHQTDRLREFQTLIRHVHQEPTQMRRALRLAFKELPVAEAKMLRDWVERRFSL